MSRVSGALWRVVLVVSFAFVAWVGGTWLAAQFLVPAESGLADVATAIVAGLGAALLGAVVAIAVAWRASPGVLVKSAAGGAVLALIAGLALYLLATSQPPPPDIPTPPPSPAPSQK